MQEDQNINQQRDDTIRELLKIIDQEDDNGIQELLHVTLSWFALFLVRKHNAGEFDLYQDS